MEIVKINTEFIKLDQLLKWINVVSSGVEAKIVIQDGLVKLNGEIETRRGKKIYNDDIIEVNGRKYKIVNK
ncbi:ribosome-associated protein [Hypnocyclicus thermotrophus]|uniref:Ribosome-associated protein n=1 Tax=Hypnocyclicus thermotrophus TaxID=1627895 RepID=A0AA46DYB6_9FUSO|nr:S4 domain-containing protein YaaA [Hypnocyclicus thermotrophus]TDT69833.1 ribosome-associated protein [Hypnocyclicus thermotrophus]